MVIYDLCCNNQHLFEGWFKDNGDMQQQIEQGILSCPVCESMDVTKLPTASKLGKSGKAGKTKTSKQDVAVMTENQSLMQYKQTQKVLSQVHDYLDKNYTDVGNKFSEEAIKIHKGELKESNIRGTASKEQISELHKSGIVTLPIPPKPVDKQKLN